MSTPSRAGLRDRLLGLVVGLAYRLFSALPLDVASLVGGRLARAIGPCLGRSRWARRNLMRAFPEKSPAAIAAIVAAMWENLGRVAGEYPHLGRFHCYAAGGRVEVIGAEYVDQLRDDGQGGIFAAAHLGNWEIVCLGATQRGVTLNQVYRAPNNPHVAALLRRARAPIGGRYLPKGAEGAKALLRALGAGEHLGLMVDQKMNDGIPVPFFGRDAMTASALAELALRYRCPVVPARVERLGGAHFRLTVYPPLTLPDSGDRKQDVRDLMTTINALIEDWIRARPEQWLWVHKRWPD